MLIPPSDPRLDVELPAKLGEIAEHKSKKGYAIEKMEATLADMLDKTLSGRDLGRAKVGRSILGRSEAFRRGR